MSAEVVGVQLSAIDAALVIDTLNKVRTTLQQTGKQAETSADSVETSGNIMTGAFRRIGEIGVNALMEAGRAFVGFVKDSVGAAIDYEGSMNMLQAVTGATGEQMAEAGQLAQDLGADLDLPATSAADAGKAMTELAKAGLSVDQAMAAAKGTLQLAAAGGLDEAQAAEIAANALNMFGLEGSKVTDVANLLANAANASSLEVTDAADAFRQAGSVYATFQGEVVGSEQSMIDMTTAIALMGNAGIKGSDAGTSLKQTLLQLAAPSDKAKGIMKELAESIGESGDIAYDASGQMRPFRDIIEITDKATRNMTQAQRQYAIATIFGADATRSVLGLIRAGPEAWDKMQTAVTAAGGAQELAGARMKGLGGAIQGLQSQFETLALEAILPLLPPMTTLIVSAAELAGSFAGKLGPAVTGVMGTLVQIAGIIQQLFIPAVAGATAATLAWAIMNAETLGIALALVVQRVIMATTAILAQAAAIGLALLPYAAIAAAIGVVILKYNEFNDKIKSATQQLLDSKPFWQEGTKALEDYGNSSADTQAKVGPLAKALEESRTTLQGSIEDLGRRAAAGLVTDEQYQKEFESLNQLAHVTQLQSQMLETAIQAEIRAAAASATGTEQLRAQTGAHQDLSTQADLTAKDLEKLMKALEKNYQDGGAAVEAYVNTSIEFQQKLTKAVAEGNNEQLQALVSSYAQQAAAQRAHLGQMLTDYTVAQVQLKNITQDQANQILDIVTKQFGTTSSITAKAYLEMTASVDKAAQEGGSALKNLGGHLEGVASNAIETKQRMDELAHKYEIQLLDNFKEKKITAEELKRALEAIPSRVYTEVVTEQHTVYTEEDRRPKHGGQQGDERAYGGQVAAGQAYVVGEKRQEVFAPRESGTIYPSVDAYRRSRPPAQPMQINIPPPQVVVVQPANTQNNYGNTYNGGAPRTGRPITDPGAAAWSS